jgi:hypothetical protein
VDTPSSTRTHAHTARTSSATNAGFPKATRLASRRLVICGRCAQCLGLEVEVVGDLAVDVVIAIAA